jgi:hypothetical protein
MDTAALATENSFTEHVRVTAIGPTTPPPLPTGSGQREKNTTGGWRGTAALATEKSFGEHVRVIRATTLPPLPTGRGPRENNTSCGHKMFQCCSCIVVVQRICGQIAGGKGKK